jgi:hypothetical protein
MPSKPRQSAKSSVTSSNRGDLTAKRKAEGQKEHAEELEAAAQRMSVTQAAQKEEDNSTIDDFTGEGVTPEELESIGATQVQEVDPAAPEPVEEDPEPVDMTGGTKDARLTGDQRAVSSMDVEEYESAVVNKATEIVRPREDCKFHFGAGNLYTFSAGRAAKVPFEVAQHMREKGLIWD